MKISCCRRVSGIASPENCPNNNVPENSPNARMTSASLQSILTFTRERVVALRPRARELERAAAAARSPSPFATALGGKSVGVIAELKRRSPSAGEIREDLDPVRHAQGYVAGGAVALSVLTEE